MIGRLTGVLEEKKAPYLLVDVNGVGYELQAPMTTFFRLPDLGCSACLHTHMSVSETSQQLFGFYTQRERDFFRQLIKVSGVGPKMAIGIMSMEVDDFVHCVMSDNVNALVKVPGVGKKTAERLIVEMRDKLQDWGQGASGSQHVSSGPISVEKITNLVEEAESALIALGYKPAEASRAVAAANSDEITRSEDLIRIALRGMLPA